MVLRPIDDVEEHSSLEHLSFEVSSVLLPVRGLANPKARSFASSLLSIIRGKRAATLSYIIVRLSLVKAR